MTSNEKAKPTPRELQKFGVVTGLILMGVFGFLLPSWRRAAIPVWPYVPGAPLVLLGLVAPALLEQVYRGWMLIGGVLGWINTRIILSLVFFAILTPFGLLRRLWGEDVLGRRLDSKITTYRCPMTTPARDRMKEPY